jgi:hypothetical protein
MWSLVGLYIKLCVQKEEPEKKILNDLNFKQLFVMIKYNFQKKNPGKQQGAIYMLLHTDVIHPTITLHRREFVNMCEKDFGHSLLHIVHFPYIATLI